MAGESQGLTNGQMLPLYAERNIFGIPPDTPIFRIVETSRLFEDIRDMRLSHTAVSPKKWQDPNENPLLRVRYKDSVTGDDISLASLANDLYGVCWSRSPKPASGMWSYYSHGNLAVRLQTTPRKLLEGAMDAGNPFFMLQHFVGEMKYVSSLEFDEFFQDQDYSKHLDSLGQGLTLSTMRLPLHYSSEEEVRLVLSVDRNQDWTHRNVTFKVDYASIPFNWANVIDSVVVDPDRGPGAIPPAIAELAALGINCPVI